VGRKLAGWVNSLLKLLTVFRMVNQQTNTMRAYLCWLLPPWCMNNNGMQGYRDEPATSRGLSLLPIPLQPWYSFIASKQVRGVLMFLSAKRCPFGITALHSAVAIVDYLLCCRTAHPLAPTLPLKYFNQRGHMASKK
jgi:hypothetical protein